MFYVGLAMATVGQTPLSSRRSSRLVERARPTPVSSRSVVHSGSRQFCGPTRSSHPMQRTAVTPVNSRSVVRSQRRLSLSSRPTPYSRSISSPVAVSDVILEPSNKHISASSSLHRKRGKTLKWLEEDMVKAINHVTSNPSTSVRKACVLFGVPRSTLRDRLSGRIAPGSKPGRKPLLDRSQESKLLDYAGNRAELGIGFGKSQFLQYASQLAKKYGVKFGGKKGYPSQKWWSLMKRRHAGSFAMRQPEGTASVRHQCMEPGKVAKYFLALKGVLDESQLLNNPNSIWNMDETGLQLDVKPRKIVARKGTKSPHSRTSGNRETITVIACVSASGKSVPPHMIIKGKTQKSLNGFDTESAPPDTNWSWSDSGWTKQGLAKLWFTNTFLPHIGPHRPQLLVCLFVCMASLRHISAIWLLVPECWKKKKKIKYE
jgi:helix-turn-helix, Psq domain/DDE superfamily endonuclease